LNQHDRADALLTLLHHLKSTDYRFVTPTPATHKRVLARTAGGEASDLRGVLGWSLPFRAASFDPTALRLLREADALKPLGNGLLKSRVRVSSLRDQLFVHSAFPTDEVDAVFFGPDSYRFAELISGELERAPPSPGAHLVDVGAGAGVGAIVAACLRPDLAITMTDINDEALAFAKINAAAAGVTAAFAYGEDLEPAAPPIDLVLANPPYIIDDAGRTYRDGGDMHGARVAYDMVSAALDRLSPGGRMILYTGSPIIGGGDPFRDALADLADEYGCTMRYWEIDPDVFGEELEREVYKDVERIAVVGAALERG
jgi:methylase of polypeptide subunit release factors